MRKMMLKLVAVATVMTALMAVPNLLYATAAAAQQHSRSSYYRAHHGDSVAASRAAGTATRTTPTPLGGGAQGAPVPAHPIDAYSDTTSSAPDSASVGAYPQSYVYTLDDIDGDKFMEIVDLLMKHGTAVGVIFGIIGILLVLIICALPLLVVILPIIYLIKRSDDKTRLAEKAIENGAPLPNAGGFGALPDEIVMKGGIRQTAIGIGLCLMGIIIGLSLLTAAGALVTALGVGKIISARVGMKRRDKERNDVGDDAAEPM